MPPFHEPTSVVHGIKERIESLCVHVDRLFVGTSTGSLQIYELTEDDNGVEQAELVTTKNLGRKAIDQISYSKDINSLIVLSDSLVTIYPLPDLVPPTPLHQTRTAFSFALHSGIERVSPDGKPQAFEEVAAAKSLGVPTIVTTLVIGCQRRLLILTWRDGEIQEPREAPLPHSPRTISFLTPSVLCFAYTATDHVLFFTETMSTLELTIPTSPLTASTSAKGIGRGAFAGFGGYMTLGLSAKAKPIVENVGNDQVMIPKENSALIVGADGLAKHSSIEWPAPPEYLAYVKPYVLSVLPPGSIPNPSDKDVTGMLAMPVIQVVSSITHIPVQVLQLPAHTNPTVTSSILRILTSSPISASPLYFISTPNDRYVSASEGSTIWKLKMRTWAEQIDELVDNETYDEALSLLATIDKKNLPDKDARVSKIRALEAVANFEQGDFDRAINTFIDLDTNPAKVVAMFPENISGRLYVSKEQWLPLFGGQRKERRSRAPSHSATTAGVSSSPRLANVAAQALRRPASPDPRTRFRAAAEVIRQAAARDDDAVSIRSRTRGRAQSDSTKAIETLLRYLSDRRPHLNGALAAVHINTSQSHRFPNLSETSPEELFSLPSVPLTGLTPEQLIRFAQIVDTALFKSYLVIRPGLLGPLCRIENWCEVSEVEETLQEREKYQELIFLYYGKKMHRKAVDLLKRLSEKQDDAEMKCRPTMEYLQKLDAEHMDLIFDTSRWLFRIDANLAFEVFTNELNELPRSAVADFLEELDPIYCARFLEYLIAERDEGSQLFHDRLAELYLEMVLSAKKQMKDNIEDAYSKFLGFIKRSEVYRPDRLLGMLPTDDMFEARAVLLGRLGKHEGALETYVYRLSDFEQAEEYCKSVYRPGTPTQDVFLSLLKIYLQPQSQAQSVANYLRPALALISRHSPRLNVVETLQLLPPLVTAEEVKSFLYEAVREPVFDTRVVREIRKGRSEQVDRKLMTLQSQRVKVTDSRICPQCHKRLGNSVIAVHTPRGEVTHYQCREAFSRSKGHAH